jgi:hypothetical protein
MLAAQMLRVTRSRRRAPSLGRWACGLALGLGAVVVARSNPARAEDLLRGPHPFLAENEVTLDGGLQLANVYGGLSGALGYGFQAAGPIWFELRLAVRDGELGPDALETRQKCACPQITSGADVQAGLGYRLRLNVPVVVAGRVLGGPTYTFRDGGSDGAGVALRGALGGRYYLYDWLGFGGELGLQVGTTGLPSEAPGMARILELTVGAAVQF